VANGALIVGASLAGLRMAEQLRAAGYTGPITIAGAEPLKPYNRPPLSKDVLLGSDADPGQVFQSLAFGIRPTLGDVTWKLGSPAVSADISGQHVTFADGTRITFDALGVATGLTPRRLSLEGCDAARYVVRTLDDALRLRDALQPGLNVVVAGGGFIGCEVAASAAKRGCNVTIVEPMAAPMLRAIGPTLAAAMQRFHEKNGVRFVIGISIAHLISAGTDARILNGVGLSDGMELSADILIEAIGSTSNTEWLDGNGLDLTDGVLTTNAMSIPGHTNVAAAGDIARFPNPRYGAVARRIEHWAIPALTAKQAAISLAAVLAGTTPDPKPFDPVPTFWSDQFGVRLQSAGSPALGDRSTVLEGDPGRIGEADGALAMGYWQGDRLIGVITIGLPVQTQMHYRKMLG
jgi:3-phenylpropionate/trans-cinnamate dioxygenase ferredoxin reductase component